MTDFTIESADRLRRSIGDIVRAMQQLENAPNGQIETLGFLRRDGRQSIASLARRRRVKHQSMSGAIVELESQGLVVRTPDPLDGRGVLIDLTEAGSAMVDESRTRRSAIVLRVAERTLTQSEQDALAGTAALLDKLRDGLLSE